MRIRITIEVDTIWPRDSFNAMALKYARETLDEAGEVVYVATEVVDPTNHQQILEDKT